MNRANVEGKAVRQERIAPEVWPTLHWDAVVGHPRAMIILRRI